MSSTTTAVIVISIIVVALGVVAFFVIRRRRYIRALRDRGWIFESTPALSSVLDHHAPPFGLGFERDADEGIAGRTRSGIPFRVFEYRYYGGGGKFDARVASLALPLPLPDLFVSAGRPRSGVRYRSVDLEPGLLVQCADADAGYARALLAPPVLAAIAGLAQAGLPVDLSIDGAALVAVGAPEDPEELEAYLDRLEPVARAIDPAALAPYAQTPAPPFFGFHGRPDWVLVGQDDSLIAKFRLTTAGSGHRTAKVLRGFNDGLPVEAFEHHRQTTSTTTSTDSEGRSHTQTVTHAHQEVVTAICCPSTSRRCRSGGRRRQGGARRERGVQRPVQGPGGQPEVRLRRDPPPDDGSSCWPSGRRGSGSRIGRCASTWPRTTPN